MEDTNLSTDVSTALTPAVESALPAASTPGGDQGGLAQVAQGALDQATGQPAATIDPVAQALSAIPADDNDLAAITDQQHLQALTGLRGQLRVVGNAYRELEPLRIYQEYGDPKIVANRLNIAKLLFTPVLGPDRKPVRDPNTQTIRITTKPFVEYLDRTRPGMPEQLLVDLLALETENEQGIKEPLVNQVFRFYRLDFDRLPEYQTIDTRIARSTGTITPEELAEIPSEFHAAYRTIPPSIRAAWASYEKADQDRMLADYKHALEATEREQRRAEEDQRRQEFERQQYAAFVDTKKEEYLNTVRRERTGSLITSLSQQVTFSTDPTTNKVMLGSLVGSLAQLFDPAWRFVVEEQVLAPMGLKIDHTFDEALSRFDDNAAESVAQELAGNPDGARDARDIAVSAANQMVAKIAIFALAIAKRQGAAVVEKAATLANNLAVATAGRPGTVTGQVAPTNGRLLPEGVRPGTDEAANALAYSTGLFQTPAG